MKSFASAFFLTVLICVICIPSVEAGNVAGKCLPKLEQIKKTGRHWTVFAGNDPNKSGQACGWVMNFPDRDAAVNKALSECRASERDHPTWGRTGSCHVIYTK